MKEIPVTVWAYCIDDPSLIENYQDAIANDDIWVCHHRLETHDENGRKREKNLSSAFLKKNGLYYHRPATELIFLRKEDHWKIHHARKNEKYDQILDCFERCVLKLDYFNHNSERKSRLELIYKYEGIKGLEDLGDYCVDNIYFNEDCTPCQVRNLCNVFEMIRLFVLVFDESPVSKKDFNHFYEHFPNKYSDFFRW